VGEDEEETLTHTHDTIHPPTPSRDSGHGQKTVFKASSGQYNPFFVASAQERKEKNLARGWRSPDRLLLRPPLPSRVYETAINFWNVNE
jgi:hypothetical protein